MKGRVSSFLNEYKNPNSFRNNRGALKSFFTFIYGSSNVDLTVLDAQADKYFSERRDYEDDLLKFLASLDSQAPKTVSCKITGVRVFFSENDLEFSNKFWRKIKRRGKGSEALTMDKIPNNQDLRKILMHLLIGGQALTLLLLSSGMRIGEALKLVFHDIKLDETPARVNVRGEIAKNKKPRITFISREAKEVLLEWIKNREQYIQVACRKSHLHKKQTDDPRVFPFSDATFYMAWNNALKKAGLFEQDPSTNRTTIHPHTLRKFFRAKLGMVISVDVAEALMGHGEYLTKIYRRYPDPEKTLREEYNKGEHALLIFGESEQLTKWENEKRQMQNTINSLVFENTDLKQRIGFIENGLKELRNEMMQYVQESEK